jgi:hypothetical protein
MKVPVSQSSSHADDVANLVATARRKAQEQLIAAEPDRQTRPQGQQPKRAAVANCGTCDT